MRRPRIAVLEVTDDAVEACRPGAAIPASSSCVFDADATSAARLALYEPHAAAASEVS
jgi:hypothetical protein